MRIGCTFPNDDIENDPSAIRDFAQAAEALGYSHITIYDHVLGAVHEGRDPPLAGPLTEENPLHEPFVTLGFLAACTTRIELVIGVLVLPQRQTVLVAKQAAEVANLSNGRLRLGIGSGWNYVEYQGLNQDWHTRGRRQEEQLGLLRRLWEEKVVNFEGRFHRIDRAGINPRPKEPIPLWMGGNSEAAYRRAARYADGFIMGGGGRDAPIEQVSLVRGFVSEAGRDAAAFGIEGTVDYAAGADRWQAELEVWQAAGAGSVTMRALRLGLTGCEAQIEGLRRFAEATGVRPEGA